VRGARDSVASGSQQRRSRRRRHALSSNSSWQRLAGRRNRRWRRDGEEAWRSSTRAGESDLRAGENVSGHLFVEGGERQATAKGSNCLCCVSQRRFAPWRMRNRILR